jgi:hypothetical protein
MIIAIIVGLIQSLAWNSVTSLFPRIIGFPALALTIAVLVVTIRRDRKERSEKLEVKIEQAKESDSEFRKTFKTTCILIGWLIGFVLIIWLIGINIAIPIYTFTYMKIQGKYGWILSTICGASTGIFVFLVFNIIFHIVWPDSVIGSLWG